MRSPGFPSRRLLGVGAGVLLVTLATGAGEPVTKSLEAFVKVPGGIPVADAVLPEVAIGARRPVATAPARPTANGLAADAVGSMDIPASALRAYRAAEAIMRSTSPSCGLTWEVLAGIGRVESDHGRYGGAVIGEDGVSSPQIYGVPLNGVGNVAAIADTEDGAMDGDTTWDRAVGPMQFLPTTWDLVQVDGDRDGVANPHDLDDAALGAAIYLCAGDADLRDREQLRSALWRYNPSEEYVALVLSYIDAYRRGDTVAIPVDETSSTDPTSTGPTSSNNPPESNQSPNDGSPNDGSPDQQQPPNDGPQNGGPPDQQQPPNDGPQNGGPPDQQPPPDNDPPNEDPPDQQPPPDNDPPNEDPPDEQPPPDDNDDPPNEPSNEPELTAMSGVLQRGDDGSWLVDDTAVYLGPDDYVREGEPSHDYDADGTVEATVQAELEGLIGQTVNLKVEVRESDGRTDVYTIDGMNYRPTDGSPPPWQAS